MNVIVKAVGLCKAVIDALGSSSESLFHGKESIVSNRRRVSQALCH